MKRKTFREAYEEEKIKWDKKYNPEKIKQIEEFGRKLQKAGNDFIKAAIALILAGLILMWLL